jgi:hypothetical protein
VVISLLLLVACTKDPSETDPGDTDPIVDTDPGDTDDTADTDPVEVTYDGTCADDVHWGAFTVDSSSRFGSASGSVRDGVVPDTVLTRVTDSGSCTIWRRENPYCDGGCETGYVCGLDGECVPYPVGQDVGTVTIDGLVQPVAMTPVAPGNTYFDTTLPNPPWSEPGLLVEMRIAGGVYESAVLHGETPAKLTPTASEWVVTSGEPLAVAWDAPAGAVNTQVTLSMSIDQHGVTPSSLRCTFEDTGSAEVPADILGQLMGYGITGFPAGSLVRRSADKADIGEGCVDLVVSSTWLPAKVTITGYTPCNFDEDCPDGQTCNEALQRCE